MQPKWQASYFFFCCFLFNAAYVECDRVKRIVGGKPASKPPAPGLVNFVDENYPGDVPSSTTSTTPEPDFEENLDDSPVVFTKRHGRRSEITGVNEDGYYAFKGIKYAEPPIGKLRFQRPIRIRLSGKLSATKFPPPCPQPLPSNKGFIGEEDCLYLNVFTPKIPKRGDRPDGGLPVLFWIHGGGFRRGSGSQYGPKDIVKKGVVVVTIQYRLGSLGFLNRKSLDVPGNSGLFDINAAFKWVKQYIRFFGGNSKQITPSGQGCGASAACMIASNKFNSDNIKGIFAMSGSSVSSFATDEKQNISSTDIGELSSCPQQDGVEFIRCMQKLPVDKIIEADNKYQDQKVQQGNAVKTMGSPLGASPTVEGKDDGRFLPYFNTLPPIEVLQSGNFVKVPLLTGTTKEETSNSVKGGLFGQIQKFIGGAQDLLTGGLFNDLLTVNTGLYTNGSVNPALGALFKSQEYLSVIATSLTNSASQIEKMIEATTDALFNLPAFVTSQLWSKNSDAYLYAFEHESGKSNGKLFLDGLPLVTTDKAVDSKGMGHGDDLIYLFDPCTLQGEPINEGKLNSEKDLKVRNHFTSLVAEFAKTGKPQIKEAGINPWSPFKDESSPYLVLSDNPTVKSGFRKCQMALWAGLGEILKSAECNSLKAGELVQSITGGASSNLLSQKSITNAGSALTGISSNLNEAAKNKTIGIITNPIGGLLGGGNKQNTQDPKNKPKPKPSITNPVNLGGGFGFGR